MILPTIHLNGTSASDLYEQYADIASGLRDALRKLAHNGPNGRDYYPQGSEAFSIATLEHHARYERVKSVLEEVEQLLEHVAERVK